MNHLVNITLVFALLAQLVACASSPKTEADEYSEMQNGTLYRAYRKLSIEAMKPVVREYDKKLAEQNRNQAGKTHVHALLGLIWVGAGYPEYALAESDYAVSQAGDPRDRYTAMTVQALAMHRKGWHHLGKDISNESKSLVEQHGLSNRYDNILVLVHIAGGALALQEGNISHTIESVRQAGLILEEPWLVELGGVTQDAYSGQREKAIARLEKLKSDPNLSAAEKQSVDEVLKIANSGGRDTGKRVAKAVVSVAMQTGIKNHPLTDDILREIPEEYRQKIAGFLAS